MQRLSLYAKIKHLILLTGVSIIKPFITWILLRETLVWGDSKRLRIAKSASMANTLYNTIAGTIRVGDYTFCGHNVCIITGTHSPHTFLSERLEIYPLEGNDIVIGNGVWIGTGAIIIGPCTIGDHAVIAAGAVVIRDVEAETIVGGSPARKIGFVQSKTMHP